MISTILTTAVVLIYNSHFCFDLLENCYNYFFKLKVLMNVLAAEQYSTRDDYVLSDEVN